MVSWHRWLPLSLLPLVITGCGNSAKSPEEINKIATESVILINYKNQPGHGTAFFVTGEDKEVCTLLTVRHVVPPGIKVQLQTQDQKIWEPADIKRFPNQDLAVVTFKPESGTCPYQALSLGNSDKVGLGQSIYITGFPGTGTKQQFSIGSVSLIDNQIEGYGISYTAITAAGMSGSPVINALGEVIAVHGRTDVELITEAKRKGEQPPPQQQSTGGVTNPAFGDAVGTFKWGIPINLYLENVQRLAKKQEEPENFFNKGNSLFDSQRYEEAIAAYDKAIAIKPDYAYAWNNRGNALGELKRYEEAIAAYDKAIAIKPDYADAWYNRGVALGELKRYEEAIAAYDKAIAIKPDYASAWNNRGVALGELKRYEEAIAAYDKAIAIKPDYADAWNNRGNALRELKRYEEAIAAYDKAIAIKPDYASAWNNRGVALGELKRYEEAIAAYDKAIAIKPDYASAWNNRGVALGGLKRYEEAIAAYDKAIAIKPDYASAWNNRGAALENLQRYEEAIAAYDKAIQFDPNYQKAINNRRQLLIRLGRSQ
ncbi:tetratricopeptide repeat-containing S1 family peptidase [Aetokthonos hydrillicola]|uniref:tetratricopeptide repeat-containing S1 family peptidase n=1 Tax=Aetokthonos hydrillicola TaxID=1550245 RepID=UPI001FB9B843|nr:tetratricopeptide repeat-containing serine protease family protein [Aetokthonos hydrillicola]